MIQHDLSLEELLGVNLNWRLDLSPDGSSLQVINQNNQLICGVNNNFPKAANLILTAPKLVDALSQCVILLSNPEMYPQMGQVTIAYAASVLRQCAGDIH
jgi:hypothetical protein